MERLISVDFERAIQDYGLVDLVPDVVVFQFRLMVMIETTLGLMTLVRHQHRLLLLQLLTSGFVTCYRNDPVYQEQNHEIYFENTQTLNEYQK